MTTPRDAQLLSALRYFSPEPAPRSPWTFRLALLGVLLGSIAISLEALSLMRWLEPAALPPQPVQALKAVAGPSSAPSPDVPREKPQPRLMIAVEAVQDAHAEAHGHAHNASDAANQRGAIGDWPFGSTLADADADADCVLPNLMDGCCDDGVRVDCFGGAKEKGVETAAAEERGLA
mmetsp:Transcript_14714/g.31147  ORF Transcript_14714/g.31147 Transcript_14714/m.31147 type:complete len:177 (+) Transcript_14714:377-907(+)